MKQAWQATTTGRSLGLALAISLALHVVLVLQDLSTLASGQAPSRTMPQTLTINAVLHPSGTGPAAAPIDVSSPAADLASPRVPDPQRLDTPPLSPPPVTRGENTHISPATTAAPAESPSTSEVSNSPIDTRIAAPADNAGLDANGLRQYRVGLAVAARRFRKYPAEALSVGMRGAAEIRLAITATGLPQAPQLHRSSGNELLDAAAIDMIANAAQATSVPISLRGQPFSVILPVEFGSREE